jgi:stringent starvation protein B
MIVTQEQQKEFEQVVRPIIKWLNENCHPHVSVRVDCSSAELSEGICSTGQILDYIKD